MCFDVLFTNLYPGPGGVKTAAGKSTEDNSDDYMAPGTPVWVLPGAERIINSPNSFPILLRKGTKYFRGPFDRKTEEDVVVMPRGFIKVKLEQDTTITVPASTEEGSISVGDKTYMAKQEYKLQVKSEESEGGVCVTGEVDYYGQLDGVLESDVTTEPEKILLTKGTKVQVGICRVRYPEETVLLFSAEDSIEFTIFDTADEVRKQISFLKPVAEIGHMALRADLPPSLPAAHEPVGEMPEKPEPVAKITTTGKTDISSKSESGEEIITADKEITTLDEKVSTTDKKVSALDEKVSALDEKVSTADEKVSTDDKKISIVDKKAVGDDGKKWLSGGMMIAIIGGVSAAIILIVVIVSVLYKKKKTFK